MGINTYLEGGFDNISIQQNNIRSPATQGLWIPHTRALDGVYCTKYECLSMMWLPHIIHATIASMGTCHYCLAGWYYNIQGPAMGKSTKACSPSAACLATCSTMKISHQGRSSPVSSRFLCVLQAKCVVPWALGSYHLVLVCNQKQ